jgi:hypothetical protein
MSFFIYGAKVNNGIAEKRWEKEKIGLLRNLIETPIMRSWLKEHMKTMVTNG